MEKDKNNRGKIGFGVLSFPLFFNPGWFVGGFRLEAEWGIKNGE